MIGWIVRLATVLCLAATNAGADAPRRVVSMNLCTDQLALMLAAPGQLVSVSFLATDPYMSTMVDAARGIPANAGGAEEIFLLEPDLVLAGTYSDPTVIAMLRRLGVRVEQVDIVHRLSDVADRVEQVGRLLGREEAARETIAAYRAAMPEVGVDGQGPTAAFYYPNGYSLGTDTLSHDILTAAGFRHLSEDLERDASGRLPLEMLVMAEPDLLITAAPYPGASRSEDIMRHPALRKSLEDVRTYTSGPEWVCGTPNVTTALRELSALRQEMEGD